MIFGARNMFELDFQINSAIVEKLPELGKNAILYQYRKVIFAHKHRYNEACIDIKSQKKFSVLRPRALY